MHFVSEDARLRAGAPRAHTIVGRFTGERLINPRCLKIGNFFTDQSDAMFIIGMSR